MRIFPWSAIFVLSLLLLSACGQKGPLTLPRDAPTETQAEEQTPPEDQPTEDNGVDDHGENDGEQ